VALWALGFVRVSVRAHNGGCGSGSSLSVANIEVMLEIISTIMASRVQSEYTERDKVLLDLKIKVLLSDFASFDKSMKCRSDAVDIVTSS
jgi:hypothetical protein